MRITKVLIGGKLFSATLAIACCVSFSPSLMQAQDNGVFNSSDTVVPSTAFIDAALYCGSGGSSNCFLNNGHNVNIFDFCGALESALQAVSSTGGVIDARGVVAPPGSPNGGGGSQLCNEDPFAAAGIQSGNIYPITVLLPASTIVMNPIEGGGWGGGWVVPRNVRLIGEGAYTALIFEPSNTYYTSTYILQMGGNAAPDGCQSGESNVPCSGISVEHLEVGGDCPSGDGNPSNSVSGIVNYYAQDSSYVNDVSMCDIGATGVYVGPNAANSGPYTNINYNSASTASSYCTGGLSGSCPACIDIETETRGVQGVTCIGVKGVSGTGSSNPLASAGDAAIYVNYRNNTVDDVHIEAFYDGIEVGDAVPGDGTAVSNVVISNVNGGTNGNGAGPTTNVVHICGQYNNQPSGYINSCHVTTATVTDVSLRGVTANSGACSTVIQDDVTGSSIGPKTTNYTASSTLPLGVYVLGEQTVSGSGTPGGWSRFSTSPSIAVKNECNVYETQTSYVPTWGVGSSAPSSSGACDTPGAIYSNTGGVSGTSIWVCTIGGTWSDIL